jgi:uncharacterized protein YxjI
LPFCTNCGKEIPENAVFCANCGKPTGFTMNVVHTSSPGSAGNYGAFSRTADLLKTNEIIMKKKLLSMREHYDFEDRNAKKLGEGDGNFFQFPAKFAIFSATEAGTNQEVMHLEGKLISFRHEFAILDEQGNSLGTIKRKIAKLVGEEYWIEQNGTELMRIYGNFSEHDYTMAVGGQSVAQVHKKWVAIRDQFGVSITGEVDPRLVIGSVIVIEHVEVTERNH